MFSFGSGHLDTLTLLSVMALAVDLNVMTGELAPHVVITPTLTSYMSFFYSSVSVFCWSFCNTTSVNMQRTDAP